MRHFLMIFNHFAKGFNGVVGMIERGEAQLAASLLVINAQRMRAVNFSLPISFEPYTMMFRRPEELTRYLLFIGNVQFLIHFMTVLYTRWRFNNYKQAPSLILLTLIFILTIFFSQKFQNSTFGFKILKTPSSGNFR